MFIDHVRIHIIAGDGGNGAVSFHTAKYIPNGGPDGGNGGKGGSVIFVGDDALNTLQAFRFKHKFVAQSGENGGKGKRAGAKGQDLLIKVPLGTVISDAETGQILADITEKGEEYLAAQGGRGGTGNACYATSTRQAPAFAKAGERGEALDVHLELKLLADVGLVGMPNVGKSTFLSVVTRAKPQIANYHFTTLSPILGIAAVEEESFIIADIPGLIEGASEGQGLGHDFLRHIERTRLLVHFLDVSGHEGRDPLDDFEMINKELVTFSEHLNGLPMLVALNKVDLADDEQVIKVHKTLEEKGYEVFNLCAPIHIGTDELLKALARRLRELPKTEIKQIQTEAKRNYVLAEDRLRITRRDDAAFVVEAPWLDRFVRSINFEDYESIQYFQNTLKRRGVFSALEARGIKEGDTVSIEGKEFDYIP